MVQLTKEEYVCQYTGEIECIESCESRALGKGCKDRFICIAYTNANNLK